MNSLEKKKGDRKKKKHQYRQFPKSNQTEQVALLVLSKIATTVVTTKVLER